MICNSFLCFLLLYYSEINYDSVFCIYAYAFFLLLYSLLFLYLYMSLFC